MGFSPGSFTADHVWAGSPHDRDYEYNEVHWEVTRGQIVLWYPKEVGEILILTYEQARLCRDQLNTVLASKGQD